VSQRLLRSRAIPLARRVEGVIDGGERSGDVSSVVDLSVTPWRVLREGAVSTAELARVLKLTLRHSNLSPRKRLDKCENVTSVGNDADVSRSDSER